MLKEPLVVQQLLLGLHDMIWCGSCTAVSSHMIDQQVHPSVCSRSIAVDAVVHVTLLAAAMGPAPGASGSLLHARYGDCAGDGVIVVVVLFCSDLAG